MLGLTLLMLGKMTPTKIDKSVLNLHICNVFNGSVRVSIDRASEMPQVALVQIRGGGPGSFPAGANTGPRFFSTDVPASGHSAPYNPIVSTVIVSYVFEGRLCFVREALSPVSYVR